MLLILAGITINMLFSENGIITMAKEAVQETKKEEEKEAIGLAYESCLIENLGNKVTVTELQDELQKKYGKNVNVEKQDDDVKVTFLETGNTYIFDGKIKEVKPITNIELSIGELNLEEIQSSIITVTTNEDADEKIIWKSSDTRVVTIEQLEEKGKVKVTGVREGNATITAQNSNGKIEKTIPVIVTVGKAGKFVKYDVPYVDINNSSYEYNATNGWRLLSKKVNKENPELYDIEIVSTGVPAGVSYHYNRINNASFPQFQYDNGGWAANESQRTKYANEFFASTSNDDQNMYGAAGLYYNFERITFKNETGLESWNSKNYNYGYYTNINNTTGQEIKGDIFRTKDENIKNKISGIRSITLADVTGKTDDTTSFTDVEGLFTLGNLANSTYAEKMGINNYKYNIAMIYWLATPSKTEAKNIYRMIRYGINTDSGYYSGVRPVIKISGVEIKDVDGVWKIR